MRYVALSCHNRNDKVPIFIALLGKENVRIHRRSGKIFDAEDVAMLFSGPHMQVDDGDRVADGCCLHRPALRARGSGQRQDRKGPRSIKIEPGGLKNSPLKAMSFEEYLRTRDLQELLAQTFPPWV